MNKRTANVRKVRINSLSYSSIFEVGDAKRCTPIAHAIAVQKQGGVQSDEGFAFENYDIFDREIITFPAMATVEQKTIHHQPNIYVNNVDIIGVSASSVAQIGGIEQIVSEARIKHIRIIDEEQNDENSI